MRGEKRLGAVGLGLFFLFPLVGLFQLGDADDGWRQVAKRTRPSVLSVHPARMGGADASTAMACAVVLAEKPLRAVVAGATPAAGMRSPTAAGWIAWKTVHTDPQGSFTILEVADGGRGEPRRTAGVAPAPPGGTRIIPLGAATMASIRDGDDDPQPVPVVLVSPSPLDELPLWVGVLECSRTATGRAAYRGTRLRKLASSDAQAAAAPAGPPNIHPALQGAPFVTREGVVIALYAGATGGTPVAVPIGLVRLALAGLESQAPR